MKPIPEGFHAITPYLFAQGASRLIEFISAAFEGELIFPAKAARWRNHARHDANRRLDADAGRPDPRVWADAHLNLSVCGGLRRRL